MKKIIIIASLIVILLSVTAVVALAQNGSQDEPEQEPKSEKVAIIAVDNVVNGERTSGEVRLIYADPAELPERKEDASGLFLSRNDDTLTLGAGIIEVEVSVEVFNDAEPVTTVDAQHSGDERDVTVNGDTVYYRDVTEKPEITPELIETGELNLTSTLEAGSLGDIENNMVLRVWGHDEGGELVADLIVYDPVE